MKVIQILLLIAIIVVKLEARTAANKRGSPCDIEERGHSNRKVKRAVNFDDEDDDESEERQNVRCRQIGSLTGILNNFMKTARKLPWDNDDDDSSEQSSESGESLFFRRGPTVDLMSYFRPWWTGSNVCKREEESVKPVDEKNIDSFFVFSGSACRDTSRSYRCTIVTRENATYVTKTTVYECCAGYGRILGQRGCPKKLELVSFEDTLNDMNLTNFLKVAKEAGLFETMESTGNYTIFVPSNQAFESSDSSDDVNIVMLDANDNSKFVRGTLSGHVVPRRVDSDSISDESKLQTLKQGAVIRTVFYNMPQLMLTANCVRVTKVDKQTVNGYIHVVDRLMPEATRSLLQILNDETHFSTFLALMDDETRKLLDDPDKHFTVFAFTDDTFDKLPQETQAKIKEKASCTADIIRNHIAPYTICSTALMPRSMVTSVNYHNLIFNVSDWESKNRRVSVNSRLIVSKDKVATNGVLHVLDGLLLFPNNQDILEAMSNIGYTELSNALKISPVTEQLSSRNDTIIYLPPVEVIRKILKMNDTESTRKLLLNHVTQRSGPNTVQTLSNFEFETRTSSVVSNFLFDTAKRTVGCARMYTEVSTCNGVIQFIDKALPLLSGSLMDILRSNTALSDFALLVEASGLDKRLKEVNQSLTLLAPTNRALKRSLSPSENTDLLQDTEKLTKFVQRHIINGSMCCDQLSDSGSQFVGRVAMFWALDGSPLSFSGSRRYGSIRVAGSTIVQCNAQAVNGILHVVDRPLLLPRPTTASFLDSLFEDFFA